MKKFKKKPVIGLLGAIASGKSFVAAEFEKLGCAVISADILAHEELLETQTQKEILKHFGDGVFDENSRVDRKKLAKAVFDDSDKLKLLNSLIHPKVIAKMEFLLDKYHNDDDAHAIVLDVPLLLEIDWQSRCDVLIFVDTKESIRIERAAARGLGSSRDVKKREKKQISLDKKRDIAHYVVDNNSDTLAIMNQVAKILSEILSDIC